jgi:hypothetical protein
LKVISAWHNKHMSSFLERLTSVIHWIAFLMSILIVVMTLSYSDPDDYLIYFVFALVPNTIGWLIKYIFTGDGNFFPFN